MLRDAYHPLRISPAIHAQDQRIGAKVNGRVRLRATVADTPQLRWWLLAFGDAVEVLGPAPLREWFAETTTGMAARYAADADAQAPEIEARLHVDAFTPSHFARRDLDSEDGHPAPTVPNTGISRRAAGKEAFQTGRPPGDEGGTYAGGNRPDRS
ncbi:MAG TPA: WYL domain-containing protein [Vicinamibacterales bacterium]|nr:WYL domain-containing protein [Vicinamibacterales bacterium]